jgi:hypothetical protein
MSVVFYERPPTEVTVPDNSIRAARANSRVVGDAEAIPPRRDKIGSARKHVAWIASVLSVILQLERTADARGEPLVAVELDCISTSVGTRVPRRASRLPIGYRLRAVGRNHPRSSQRARHRAEECRRRAVPHL